MKVTASRLTTVLAVLLGLAYVLVLSGRLADDDAPTVANASGGGLSAFAELLRRSGYRVRVEDDLRPRFSADEFVVVSLEARSLFAPHGPQEGEKSLAETLPNAPGGLLVLGRSRGQRNGTPVTFTNAATGEEYKILAGGDPEAIPGSSGLPNRVRLFGAGANSSGIEATDVGGRRLLLLSRGEVVSNRFIDQGENAALLSGFVRAVAGGKRIVFYEGGAGSGGLLASLGDWSFAARNQGLLALGLLVLSLGSRFGLAPKARRRESGQREQSDALGNLLRRWRGPRVGIEAAIEQARRRLAHVRKLPHSAPRDQWDKYLSPSLIETIEECEEWVRQRAKEREALRAIAKLDAEVDAEILGSGARPATGRTIV